MEPFRTTLLHRLIDRARTGDGAAFDELIRLTSRRLEAMARSMLRRFPNVARWEQTLDVFQNATLRLLRALDKIKPESVAAFMGLAAAHIRRELLDLARHYGGPHGHGAHHDSVAAGPGSSAPLDPAAPADDGPDLEFWSAFHEAIEKLPTEERDVIGLVFYHGWTQEEVAQLFDVNERTIRRRWTSACQRLHQMLHGRLPPM